MAQCVTGQLSAESSTDELGLSAARDGGRAGHQPRHARPSRRQLGREQRRQLAHDVRAPVGGVQRRLRRRRHSTAATAATNHRAAVLVD